jgi:hypothetical protein
MSHPLPADLKIQQKTHVVPSNLRMTPLLRHAWGACGRRFKSGRPDQNIFPSPCNPSRDPS